jgi:hypothetical protein
VILAAFVGVLVAGALWLVARPLVAGSAEGGRTGAARRQGRPVLVALLVAATAGAGVLVARAEERPQQPRPAAQQAAPNAASPAAPASPAPTDPTAASDPAAMGGAANAPTDDELAAVASAVEGVRRHPRDVGAHVELARAYANAKQAQLSAVEYLAVLELDKANPEANNALALVALGAGRPQEGKRLVDTVLAAHPRYPDALYTRGLINLMGLHRRAPGVRDLRAYLDAAPYGSHRAAVDTLLAMVSDGRTP